MSRAKPKARRGAPRAEDRRSRPAVTRATNAGPALTVRIGPLTLANPVLAASGTFGYGDEVAHVMDVSALGAVITKTVTPKPRPGNPPARIAETAGGMLNSIGLENVGVEAFVTEKLPRLAALGATIVASLGGETPHELEAMLERLAPLSAIAAFEINFSCPNVAAGGARYWAVPGRLERTLARLRRHTTKALIAKLSPDVTAVGDLARGCEQGGADAVTAVNTFVGLSLDLTHLRPVLGRRTGGLSGPAIKPLALARCDEAVRAVAIPVIGSGGIMSARDALEFLAVGAAAVQVGTATFLRPRAALEIAEGIGAFFRDRGISLATWRGSLGGEPDAQGRRETGVPVGERRTARAPVDRRRGSDLSVDGRAARRTGTPGPAGARRETGAP